MRKLRSSVLLMFGLALMACRTPVEPPAGSMTALGLNVWAEMTVPTVAIRDTTDSIAIRLYVQNPTGREIRFASGGPPYTVSGDPTRTQGLGFSVRMATSSDSLNAGPSTNHWGRQEFVFKPHETQLSAHVVTLRQWVAGGWALEPGIYRVRVWFNGHEGAGADLRLVP